MHYILEFMLFDVCINTFLQLALKEALEKAARQYHREQYRLENEDPLAEIANSNSEEAGKYVLHINFKLRKDKILIFYYKSTLNIYLFIYLIQHGA